MKLELVDYEPCWAEAFQRESDRLKQALGATLLEVHHLGSTAVPGLPAKPKIDMFFACSAPQPAEAYHRRILDLGYSLSEHSEALGHAAYNRDQTSPAYTIHWLLEGADALSRARWFRDRLRADPELCRQYAQVKREALAHCEGDRWAYNQHKAPFIQALMEGYPGREGQAP